MYFYIIKIYRTYKYKSRTHKTQRQSLGQILDCCSVTPEVFCSRLYATSLDCKMRKFTK